MILSDNKLDSIHSNSFAKNTQLKRLILQNCGLKHIPSEAFRALIKLQTLQIGYNAFGHLEADAFESLPNLRSLRIDGNDLRRIPAQSLAALTRLEVLNLGNNQLSTISDGSFPVMNSLLILLLKRNQIMSIDELAFSNISSLRILELDDNYLTQIPLAITKLPDLQELSISGNRIKYIAGGLLQQTPALALLELKGNPLVAVDLHAFSHLPRLRKLQTDFKENVKKKPNISQADPEYYSKEKICGLKWEKPHFNRRFVALSRIFSDTKSKILSDAKELSTFPHLNGTSALEVLRLDRAGLNHVPASLCTFCPKLKSLDIKSNKLEVVPQLNNCREIRVLDLASNLIRSIEAKPFRGMYQMHDLLLANNKIQYIPYDAFYNLSRLQVLDMENNHISFIHPDAFLPISKIEDLNLGNNVFPHLPSAGLEKLLHLKTFNNPNLREFPPPEDFPRIQTLILSYAYHCCAFLPLSPSSPPPIAKDIIVFPDIDDIDLNIWNSSVDIWPSQQNLSKSFGSKFEAIWENIRSDFTYPGNFPSYMEEYISEEDIPVRFPGDSLTSGFLAVVDASTLGEFRMYAIPWQMSPGCQLAGFLGVLSSELSVYTLAVITLERNYAITHAMHLNKRLSLRHAGYIMVCGWSFAIIMAILPLFSVSDYRKFAVCLPFEIKDVISLTYVVFLMLINGVAFLILMGCYLKMYCAIRGSQAWNSNDSRIAKRMALLVFTDFLCWSPIAFFSLTASFGLQLISLEQAKVFTVFVLPLNSCCNPFLYAILTKQFKKDCVMICKAIEESRVTRGIGRCRHSSNFSNRQTPANTNSLADRSSRENQNHQPPPQCTCNTKLLGEKKQPKPAPRLERQPSTKDWLLGKARWLLCVRRPTRHRRPPSNTYTYQIAEIQQKQHKRASSMSSSENFSSSRSDSWRNNAHNCGIPLRMLDPKRRASSWVVTRKTSQDSNLSSSRNDSSGSATTASTSTWRMSRSSGSSEPSRIIRVKPRLTRQYAFHDELDPPGSPGRLTVRFLTTIPSAAETSMLEEEAQSSAAVSPAKESNVPEPFYAILHSPISPVTPVRRQSIVTLHPASEVLNNNNDEVLLEKPSRKTGTNINITNNVLVDEADTGICMKNLTKIDLSVTCNGSHNEASVARPSSTSTSVSIKDVSLTNNGNSSHSGGQAPPEAGSSS
ncbi:hypothetical protein HUJ05_000063 [Dendroctonus ponderosae]|nr:hypothetical protein HUJ05_000063 [Dendroctonus ponderosae]